MKSKAVISMSVPRCLNEDLSNLPLGGIRPTGTNGLPRLMPGVSQAATGGKVGTWAATLVELASELDVVIVASAGNRAPAAATGLSNCIALKSEAFTQQPIHVGVASSRSTSSALACS